MKVLGNAKDSYICLVSHAELEKFLNLYYGGLQRLQVGQTIDLSTGYDYEKQIKDALAKTEGFITANKKIIEAIINGLTITAKLEKADENSAISKD